MDRNYHREELCKHTQSVGSLWNDTVGCGQHALIKLTPKNEKCLRFFQLLILRIDSNKQTPKIVFNGSVIRRFNKSIIK